MIAAQTAAEWRHYLSWVRNFLRQELAPYPGRKMLVARLVMAATLVMVVNMTFKVPFAAFGAVFTLLVPREDVHTTLNDARVVIVTYTVGVTAILFGALIFSSDPLLRFFWAVGSLFVAFYVLSTLTIYAVAARAGLLIILTIPLWNEQATTEYKVENTLWAVWTVTVTSLITAGVEWIFAAFRPSNDLVRFMAERLAAVEDTVRFCACGKVEEKAAEKVTRFAVLGTSHMRQILLRSARSRTDAEQMGATVAFVGRLVDLAAGLKSLDVQISEEDRQRIETLADNVAKIRTDLMAGRIPQLAEAAAATDMPRSIPLLQEIEQTVAMIPEAFTGSLSIGAFAPQPLRETAAARYFVSDAFTNNDHTLFALKGGLAASLCYFAYNGLAWPGITTSITTCLLTAFTTVGASRQRQLLRFGGAIAGGTIGTAAQVWILPGIDSIFGFTLLFLAVTAVGAWIVTSSPRLSYFGFHLLLSFYLIHLQEFKIQTSLVVTRDRVVGIFLGLLTMWLVFDQLGGVPAVVGMKRAFISALRYIARLAREPFSSDLRTAIEKSYSLRDTVNRNLDQIRTLADAVLFEFGPTRQQDLALRARLLSWSPQLRLVFITGVSLLKYRLQLPGFELPERIRIAEREFGEAVAKTLDATADRLDGKAGLGTENLEASLARLEATVNAYAAAETQGVLSANLLTFLVLSRRIESLAVSLAKEI